MSLPLKDIVNVQLAKSSGGPGIDKEIPVNGIGLSKYEFEMRVGDLDNLYPVFNPTNASDRVVYWSENTNGKVITVDSSGQVKGEGIGSGYVTCTTEDGAYRARCLYNIIRALIPVTKVTVSPTSISVEVSETSTLSAVLEPANADEKDITWFSSNTNVATVNENGVVTGVAVGTCNIIATAASGVQSNSVSVVVNPKSIKVTGVKWADNSPSHVAKDYTRATSVEIIPANASNKSVLYTSSNEAIVKISSDGIMTGVATGQAVITVKTVDGSYTAQFTATCQELQVITINPPGGLPTGSTSKLTYSVNASSPALTDISFSSDDESIVTVDALGNVTAIAEGGCNLRMAAKSMGVNVTASTWVQVSALQMYTDSLGSITVGSTKQLTFEYYPSDLQNYTITYASTDESVAAVNSAGLITAKASGGCRISATISHGGVTATDSSYLTVNAA